MKTDSGTALAKIETKDGIRRELEQEFRPFIEKSLSAETAIILPMKWLGASESGSLRRANFSRQ